MMQRVFFLLIATFLFTGLKAQKGPSFSMAVTRHYFGQIYEKNGVVKASLDFENTGTDTLMVQKIKSSAPDVTAKAEPEVVPPGMTGTLLFSFDPAKNAGRIDRFVSIRTNDANTPVVQLSLSADVISKEKTMEDKFPVKIGNLRFDRKHLAFDAFKNTEIRKDTFRLLNVWDKPMKIAMKDAPAFTVWQAIPATIPPMKQGLLIVTYDAAKSGNWGLCINQFTMTTNDSISPEKTISIGVNVLEDFSYLKKMPVPQKARCEIGESNIDFGKISEGDVKEHVFEIKNTGNALLIIRKVKTSCGCTATELKQHELKPGEATSMKAKLDATLLNGKQIKTITVICNDPEAPVKLLSLSADVGPK